MLTSVLIANRGEIACRIIRTARRLGIRTIAVFSDADRTAQHVKLADEAYHIGPAAAKDSYLVIDRIMSVAQLAGAEAIHPGYGFLSERAEFADACASAGIIFVGPPASSIRAMGLKDAAKALMEKANVPVVPGYHGAGQEPGFLKEQADRIGYPVLIKAVAGGGGKGMKRVDRAEDFADALASAGREALNAFGDPRVLIEKYVLKPRHIEIQVFGDSHGNVVHLFERDCSLQRRHQKVIEEAPAPGMSSEMRAHMGKAAVDAAKAVGYVGAGTVEFIADSSQGLRADRFYFMEMNTRLQVEHPVTEGISGQDLVEWQFRVASGERLPLLQHDLAITGHAVEARLYAEDPEKGFLPSTGALHHLSFGQGEGIRIDTGVVTGDQVSPFYDPMIAKVIAHGSTRDEALDRLAASLRETQVAGPRTNAAFLAALVDLPEFRSGIFDTATIDANLATLGAVPQPVDMHAVAAAASALRSDLFAKTLTKARHIKPLVVSDPWGAGDSFTLGALPRERTLDLIVNGDPLHLPALAAVPADDVQLVMTRSGIYALHQGRQTQVAWRDLLAVDLDQGQGGGLIKAPMHGKVVAIFVAKGQKVTRGEKIAVLEAMKMEHTLTAAMDGVVDDVLAEAGQQVPEGARLIVIAGQD